MEKGDLIFPFSYLMLTTYVPAAASERLDRFLHPVLPVKMVTSKSP